mmetsp:Transcript_19928/g.63366  ORF Transcript_19928/g.63366 Transcript_19928/m.63366 type:complete len:202 (-) Transcript_19928:51-656(-)
MRQLGAWPWRRRTGLPWRCHRLPGMAPARQAVPVALRHPGGGTVTSKRGAGTSAAAGSECSAQPVDWGWTAQPVRQSGCQQQTEAGQRVRRRPRDDAWRAPLLLHPLPTPPPLPPRPPRLHATPARLLCSGLVAVAVAATVAVAVAGLQGVAAQRTAPSTRQTHPLQGPCRRVPHLPASRPPREYVLRAHARDLPCSPWWS